MSPPAIDTMIARYLLEVTDIGYNPSTDHSEALAAERVAAFRLFMWNDMIVPPTVLTQLTATGDPALREKLERLVLCHMIEGQILERALPAIEARTAALATYHRDDLDCRILAEAESIGAVALLSFDHRFRKHLRNHAALPLVTPSKYWEQLAIPRGMPPRWTPASSNPMSRETWWHW